ncbi:MAG: hypothetical protein E6G36_08310, partial [Actinobacteria bacterium]
MRRRIARPRRRSTTASTRRSRRRGRKSEVVQARARFGVDLAPETRTPLVGRERELEQLIVALARARQQRAPELVTLIGVPGIGKSRLVGELFQSIEGSGVLTYWRQGRSLPYGAGVSYWALAEMVKAQAGILETDSDDEVEAKLARAVEQLIDEDAAWVLSHLRPLVGQASDTSSSQEEAFAAWRRFFEALAEQHPLVLMFEDIHWADDGVLDFIEHLADWVRGVPMLILCTARLELLERRPAWGGGKVNAATVALAPLSDEETAALISALRATRSTRSSTSACSPSGGARRSCRSRCRASSRRASIPFSRTRRRCCRTLPSSARCSGSGRSARRSSSCIHCSRRSSFSARAAVPSKGRSSSRSSICSCGTSRTARFHA